MASVERTAYPRFPRTITLKDLQASFTPTAEELHWAQGFARSADRRLALLVQLKCFQHLHHFVDVGAIPAEIVRHVSGCLSMPAQDAVTYPDAHRSLYRHHEAIRTLLGVRPFAGTAAKREANQIALEASQIVDTRTDVINILVDDLIQRGYELPSFSALVLIAEQVHEATQQALHERIAQRLGQAQREWLDRLIESDLEARQTLYNRIKRSAKKASRKHLDLLLGQLAWLESLPDCDALLEGVPETKLRHMADSAAVLDAGELKSYRRMGAVAYRHVADNYIAVFRHFIPPGFHEAVYVIEGLLKAGLSTKADTVYSDTHGQSETVFAFTHLMGIQLMPRIRNWKDLKFYRPDKATRFKHIDRLFTDTVDWDVIKENWQELMQVAISIKAGRIASPTLLRKLSNEGRHNRLFAAARELGRVLRTVYLLKWISSKQMRQEITGTTNKIESYHAFTKWLDFGGDVIAENDPSEQQKRLRYIDLVASAVILQNTVDMMKVVQDLYYKGDQVDVADLAYLSPYMTSAIKRFGNYHLDLKKPPEPWVKEAMFRDAAKQSRQARNGATDASSGDNPTAS
ncbi:Tn3 family transposase [Roseateles puraquae]|uniref:Tn3 family transposase n=2 Tax=Pseudomonadota TaxID=1224 RepID=A0A254NAA1_9BURK|nr:Tn3 family transposase [Roseateles puraquae]MDG0854773.1 Tn3 family transposase [Roseateles puraquae]OWR04931.1 hypothetical protein CDO81_00070 [Roseateles puraquae]